MSTSHCSVFITPPPLRIPRCSHCLERSVPVMRDAGYPPSTCDIHPKLSAVRAAAEELSMMPDFETRTARPLPDSMPANAPVARTP